MCKKNSKIIANVNTSAQDTPLCESVSYKDSWKKREAKRK